MELLKLLKNQKPCLEKAHISNIISFFFLYLVESDIFWRFKLND
ncbi:hypothetical protein MtrunA17_Chr8g0384971 [Medicago truncatula]|uniref:Uncharacterized protein n=1 Tax=Medicago truncatula TaxID=3880 RepID=A0A396GS37_MEDTR|nr:hypothetical protein MtrunA17_Chr8g0384971 [Medicago truncatula]